MGDSEILLEYSHTDDLWELLLATGILVEDLNRGVISHSNGLVSNRRADARVNIAVYDNWLEIWNDGMDPVGPRPEV